MLAACWVFLYCNTMPTFARLPVCFFEKTDTQTDGLTVTKPMLYAFHYGLGQLNFGLLSYNLHYDSYQLL